MLVSHDFRLISQVAKEIWEVAGAHSSLLSSLYFCVGVCVCGGGGRRTFCVVLNAPCPCAPALVNPPSHPLVAADGQVKIWPGDIVSYKQHLKARHEALDRRADLG